MAIPIYSNVDIHGDLEVAGQSALNDVVLSKLDSAKLNLHTGNYDAGIINIETMGSTTTSKYGLTVQFFFDTNPDNQQSTSLFLQISNPHNLTYSIQRLYCGMGRNDQFGDIYPEYEYRNDTVRQSTSQSNETIILVNAVPSYVARILTGLCRIQIQNISLLSSDINSPSLLQVLGDNIAPPLNLAFEKGIYQEYFKGAETATIYVSCHPLNLSNIQILCHINSTLKDITAECTCELDIYQTTGFEQDKLIVSVPSAYYNKNCCILFEGAYNYISLGETGLKATIRGVIYSKSWSDLLGS